MVVQFAAVPLQYVSDSIFVLFLISLQNMIRISFGKSEFLKRNWKSVFV